MKSCVIVRLPTLGGLAVIGPYDTREAAQEWVDTHVGPNASADIVLLWEADTTVKFG